MFESYVLSATKHGIVVYVPPLLAISGKLNLKRTYNHENLLSGKKAKNCYEHGGCMGFLF